MAAALARPVVGGHLAEPVNACLLFRLRSKALAMGPKPIFLLKENV